MKVLITSGGGAKGAFSVGALQYLTANVTPKFDLISGTSTGSLIAGMMAADELDTLTDVYLNTTNADVLEPFNLLDAIGDGRNHIFSTEPLLKQIDTHLSQTVFNAIIQSQTILCLNSVCLETGRLTVFSTKALNQARQYDQQLITSRSMMIKAMLASSNQPVFTEPVLINGKNYADGGNKEVIPTRVVINNLPSTENHDVYILSNNPHDLVTITDISDILKVLMRSLVVFIQEVRENDLDVLISYKKIAPSTIRIFYIRPDVELDKDFPTGLRFEKLRMQRWMNKGNLIAEQVLTDFPDGNLPFAGV